MTMLADLGEFDRAPIHEKHLGIVESLEQPEGWTQSLVHRSRNTHHPSFRS
jgi:hypothetical protein